MEAAPLHSASPEPDDQLSAYGLEFTKDGYVEFSTDSHSRPRNWPARRKAYDLGLIILLDFFTTAISAAGTPTANL